MTSQISSRCGEGGGGGGNGGGVLQLDVEWNQQRDGNRSWHSLLAWGGWSGEQRDS